MGDWRLEPKLDGLTRLEERVFIEDWRMPELTQWFTNSGLNAEEFIPYAASIVNGSYELKGFDSRDAPSVAYSALISWGLRAAQAAKKAKLEIDGAQAKITKFTNKPEPKAPNFGRYKV